MKLCAGLSLLVVLVAGCGDSAAPGSSDLSVSVDAEVMLDLATVRRDGGTCNPVDPGGDGQDCGSGCPAGTVGVNQPGGGCKCFLKCDPATPTDCSCDRRCVTLTRPDAGVVGGACFPANGPAQKCGADNNGMPLFGKGGCGQDLFCAGPTATSSYCLYECDDSTTCPSQTQCAPVYNSSMQQIGLTCQFISGSAGKAGGAACDPKVDNCMLGFICDGMCRTQCDGPGAACTSGTCTALTDPLKGGRISAYICK